MLYPKGGKSYFIFRRSRALLGHKYNSNSAHRRDAANPLLFLVCKVSGGYCLEAVQNIKIFHDNEATSHQSK